MIICTVCYSLVNVAFQGLALFLPTVINNCTSLFINLWTSIWSSILTTVGHFSSYKLPLFSRFCIINIHLSDCWITIANCSAIPCRRCLVCYYCIHQLSYQAPVHSDTFFTGIFDHWIRHRDLDNQSPCTVWFCGSVIYLLTVLLL